MKGTTFKAFNGIFYSKPLDLKNMSIVETFELMNLAERYDLPKLKKKASEGIRDNGPLQGRCC